jgi:hypothetical protein
MNRKKKLEIKSQLESIKSNLHESIAIQKKILDNFDKLHLSILSIERKIDSFETHDTEEYSLITTADEWIKSWRNNKNTGSPVEIKVGLELLLSSKLESRDKIPDIILKYSIPEMFNIYPEQSKKVVGLLNLTQNDEKDGTSDISIVYQDGTKTSFSVTQWYGKPEKCICNPSPMKIYNLEKYKKELEEENKTVYDSTLQLLKKNHGVLPSKEWKKKKFPPVGGFTKKLAKIASEEWNALLDQEKKIRLEKILDLDSSLKTKSNGLIYFNTKTNKIQCVYKWALKINLNDCLKSRYDKCNIIHFHIDNPNEILIKTQAKYNNGIIEGLNKKSNWVIKIGKPLSSWNCVAKLEKIFNMEKLEYI